MANAASSEFPSSRLLGTGGDGRNLLRTLFRALAHRNYRLFFAGQIVSLCGTFLTQVANVMKGEGE